MLSCHSRIVRVKTLLTYCDAVFPYSFSKGHECFSRHCSQLRLICFQTFIPAYFLTSTHLANHWSGSQCGIVVSGKLQKRCSGVKKLWGEGGFRWCLTIPKSPKNFVWSIPTPLHWQLLYSATETSGWGGKVVRTRHMAEKRQWELKTLVKARQTEDMMQFNIIQYYPVSPQEGVWKPCATVMFLWPFVRAAVI